LTHPKKEHLINLKENQLGFLRGEKGREEMKDIAHRKNTIQKFTGRDINRGKGQHQFPK